MIEFLQLRHQLIPYLYSANFMTAFKGKALIEPIYYEITSLLVSKATEQLNTQFYGEIFLAISDHIAFAIKRK